LALANKGAGLHHDRFLAVESLPDQLPMPMKLRCHMTYLLSMSLGACCLMSSCRSDRSAGQTTLSEARCILSGGATSGTNAVKRPTPLTPPQKKYWISISPGETVAPEVWALAILRYDGSAEDLPLVERYANSTNQVIRESANEAMRAIQGRTRSISKDRSLRQ
jgi:hypothetical protein